MVHLLEFFSWNSKKSDEKLLDNIKKMEIELKSPKEFDPYLFDDYLQNIKKFISKPENLKNIDVNNIISIFNLIRNRQKLLPSTVDDYINILKKLYQT